MKHVMGLWVVVLSLFSIPGYGKLLKLKELKPFKCKVGTAVVPISQYYVKYSTSGIYERRTFATGIIAFKKESEYRGRPLLSSQHGTILEKTKVPSRGLRDNDGVACLYTTDGYLYAESDYLGMGDSPGFHPYMHAASEASAGIDMLRAARHAFKQLRAGWNGQLFLFGYSQGGHATMALHRALNHGSFLHVTASAPAAGAYDLSGASLQGTLSDPQPRESALYSSYILSAYQAVYGDLWNGVDEVFRPAYTELPRYYWTFNVAGVMKLMPKLPSELFTQKFLDELKNENSPVIRRLAENNLYDWKPLAPVHFFYAGGDRVVHPQNSLKAYETMKKKGAEVYITNVGDSLNHATGGGACARGAKAFIDSFRETVPHTT